MKTNVTLSGTVRNEKSILALILISSFAVKILLALFIQSPIRSDSADYLDLAYSILNGEYSLAGKPTAYFGFGYPLFLSSVIYVFGDGQFFIRIIQSVIEIGTGYLFYKVCKNFFNVKYSLIALLIFSFLPSNIIFSQAVLSESLFGFFSMSVLYLVMRKDFSDKKYLIFVAGILFGYAVLIRTAYFPCIILVPVFFFIYKRSIRNSATYLSSLKLSLVFIAGVILILAPWSIRNKVELNTFSISTTTGLNFWMGSNPNATGTYYHNLDKSFPEGFEYESDRDNEYFKMGLDYAMKNPVKYLTLGIKKIVYLFSSERMAILYFTDAKPGETSTQIYRSVNPFIIFLVNVPYFFIMLSGVWGLLNLDVKNKNRFFIYGFVMIWVLIVFAFVALARYHYVLIPFFIIGTGNFLVNKDHFLKEMSLYKKSAGAVVSMFFISVWVAEFYMLYFK